MWTECDNQPTDGSDETRIHKEITTNRDKKKTKNRGKRMFTALKFNENQEVTRKGTLAWKSDRYT